MLDIRARPWIPTCGSTVQRACLSSHTLRSFSHRRRPVSARSFMRSTGYCGCRRPQSGSRISSPSTRGSQRQENGRCAP
eukprot:7006124-Pyramimonas_sp.AAC.1